MPEPQEPEEHQESDFTPPRRRLVFILALVLAIVLAAVLVALGLRGVWRARAHPAARPAGAVAHAQLAGLTLERGRWHGVSYADSLFAYVHWGPAFAGGRAGFALDGGRFERCRFAACVFDRTQVAEVELVDSDFTGSRIDLSNFNHVRFSRSAVPGAPPATISWGVVLDRAAPPPPGVEELTPPGDQVRFDGVAFEQVHFRGWIRPEWFRGCTFQHCVLPTRLRPEALAAGRNTLVGCQWADEPVE